MGDHGAQGKFSLEYGVAAAQFDGFPGQWSFTDAAVERREARELAQRIAFVGSADGEGCSTAIVTSLCGCAEGQPLEASLGLPEGAPNRPLSDATRAQNAASCLADLDLEIGDIHWESAAALLAAHAADAAVAHSVDRESPIDLRGSLPAR
ncbi:MAG: hypothetical protein ACRDL5_14325 [Solirubrobacteraceae bacterium]